MHICYAYDFDTKKTILSFKSLNMIEILVLSIIQGVTEFLPVSSSSHLILTSRYLEFQNQSLSIDVSLHIGSFLAVLFYFRFEVFNFIKNKFDSIEQYDFKEVTNKYDLKDSIIALFYKDKKEIRVLSRITISDNIILKNQTFLNIDFDNIGTNTLFAFLFMFS